MSVAPAVVFAIGNPSRGDDALGPMLAERLIDYLAQHDPSGQAIEVIIDQQLVVEHVLDLVGRSLALFVDAAVDTGTQAGGPVSLTALQPAAQAVVMSHSVSPASLLRLFQEHVGNAAPTAELLAVVGDGFELGEPLSAAARDRLEQAWSLLQGWADATRARFAT